MRRIRASEERRFASRADQEAAWTRLAEEQQKFATGEAALMILAGAVAKSLLRSEVTNEPDDGRTDTATRDDEQSWSGDNPRPKRR